MSRTTEQLSAVKELSSTASGYRVIEDEDGWPISPGRHWRLEHLGAGQLAAFTEGRQIRARLLAIPGVTRHQVGDTELRVLLTPSSVLAVARLLRCHRKRTGRQPTPAQLAGLAKARLKAVPGGSPRPVEAGKAAQGISTGSPQ
jgi:hypothetical protein